MANEQTERLSDAELKVFFNRLFPHSFAGADVLAEIAPEGWEKSPLLACFHPSVEQVFKERLQLHRNLEDLVRARREREPDNPKLAPKPEPTLEEVRAERQEMPVNVAQEVTELVGLCLWDVFSDNHDVIAPDGRAADLGSFRGTAGFIAEYLSGPKDDIWNMDYMRFYMGTIWIRQRADLAPVYRMIFGRLKALDADWHYQFPQLHLMDLSPLRQATEKPEDYSPSEAFGREQEQQAEQEELERFRADLAEANEQARRKALDKPPPLTVRIYQEVFGRDPTGWPPA